jgi:zinc D-Ala-D-Ala dipeptidase
MRKLILVAGVALCCVGLSMAQNTIDPLEKKMIAKGLVDIQKIDPTIEVDLKYSTTDNFVKADVYGDLTRAYLQPMAAQKLAKASQYLRKTNPNYHLLVYDAARPRSVTVIFWNKMSHLPPNKREDFVANPKEGSIHNFGCAVDLTIADKNGKALDMGTPFDFFGDLAWPTKEQYLLKKGKLTKEQIANRTLLKKAMTDAGYIQSVSEWWHFNAASRAKARAKYGFIE